MSAAFTQNSPKIFIFYQFFLISESNVDKRFLEPHNSFMLSKTILKEKVKNQIYFSKILNFYK